MKSEYRQAVESVIAQEAKLAEVARLHAAAVAEEKKLAEALRFNRESLARYEARLASLERAGAGGAKPSLRIWVLNEAGETIWCHSDKVGMTALAHREDGTLDAIISCLQSAMSEAGREKAGQL